MKHRLPIAAALALLALPGLALAGPGYKGDRAACRAKHEAQHLSTYDTDGDGALSREERRQLRADKKQAALARFDANRDGVLDEAEREQLRGSRIGEKFARLDSNRDGAISRAEASAPCSRMARRFETLDANRDGLVTRAELAAGKRQWKKGGWHKGKHGKKGMRRGAPPAAM